MVLWELAVVFVWFVGLLIPVQADVADLCAWYQSQDAVYHAKSGPQDRDNSQFLSGNHWGHAGFNRSFHLYFLGGKIAQSLISHEHGDFLN